MVKDVQYKVDELKTARANEDVGTIKTATEALSSALMKIGEAMAGISAKASTSQETPPTTDAEFKEKPLITLY